MFLGFYFHEIVGFIIVLIGLVDMYVLPKILVKEPSGKPHEPVNSVKQKGLSAKKKKKLIQIVSYFVLLLGFAIYHKWIPIDFLR